MFQTSVVFEANRTSTHKVNVNQGGTSSGKTYSILQLLFLIAIEDPGCVITIAGQDIPNLKKGAIRDAQKILTRSSKLQAHVRAYNRSERIFYFWNGSTMEFSSFSNEQDARSGKRDYLFVNEANGITYEIYWQLFIRTKKKVFIDYNPSSKFWVHEKLIGTTAVKLIISDHRHNPFLSKSQHDEIESIPDKELWKVYARGLTGRIHGLIYPVYNICDGIPANVETVLGLDFGYNHKSALIEVGRLDNRLFWHELIYLSELTIGDLINEMKQLNLGKKPIYADHAAPDKIEDIRRAGFKIFPADKDVKNGIDYVKRHHLYVTAESVGLRKEIMTYKWKENKDSTLADEPVKRNDDGMDAGRYGSYTAFRKPKGVVVAETEEPSPLDWLD